MSGGIDSTMSAIFLQEMGFDVVGISFKFYGSDDGTYDIFNDAADMASRLGIQHYTVDLREEFSNTVIKYFTDEYLAGRTPFPCAWCNPHFKFKYLQKFADKLGCFHIATGHYVRIDEHKGKKYLFSGEDPDKDQSFFLWNLPWEIVERIIFPLGTLKKSEIRKEAEHRGYKLLSKKKDSLGICFVEGQDYRKFLESRGVVSTPGNFVDHNNKVIGTHKGIVNYTIGQRRGLGMNLNYPVFVSEIRPERNEIVVSKYEDLYKNIIRIRDYYFADKEFVESGSEMTVKVRYRLQETPCKLNILDETRAEVVLLKPEAMISPGQTAVFYDGDRLLGGGFIESSE